MTVAADTTSNVDKTLPIAAIQLTDLSVVAHKDSDEIDTAATPPSEASAAAAAHQRPVWTNSLEVLMSCISASVGLGNVWRFPFVAYENGGGAFLIPYIIVLLIIGKPLYYLEMIIGQFTSRSSIKMYDMCPLFRGIGVGQMFGTVCIITYYCSLIATTLFYFVASFSTELPWSKCLASWGAQCVDSQPAADAVDAVAVAVSANETIRPQSSSELYFL